MSGTCINIVPNVPKCPVPVLCRTELTEVSCPGNTGGIYRRYASVCTVPNSPFVLFKMYPLDYQLKKRENKNGVSLNLEKIYRVAFLRLILMRIRFRASDFGRVAKTNLVCAKRNRLHVPYRMRRWYSCHSFVLLVWFSS